MPVARSRTSNVGEAHRRALERRQIAQQSGETVPRRRLDTIVSPEATSGAPDEHRDDRRSSRAAVVGDEGVGRPRLAGASSPPPIQHAPHLAVTANLPAMPSQGDEAQPAAPSYRTPPPGTQMSSIPPEYQQPLPPRQADSTNAPRYTEAPGPPMAPRDGRVQPLEAEWYAAERQRHRGKRCANCRDFQAAENGDRGWCRNHFAFPTPQLVGPNDLACLSCIGTWWAANDQWWLAKAAIPQQVAGTPLADALLEELHEEEKHRSAVRRPGAS